MENVMRLIRWGVMLLALAGGQSASAQTVVRYIHTDALGSVVAITDESGNFIERREYEPYGAQLTPAMQDGPGYTGHVQDTATGLVYMQQRYYDPLCGCFLSADPVTAYDQPIVAFNRYRYANSNPYKFTDPDGRESSLIRAMERDHRAFLSGEMPGAEVVANREARGFGAAAGAAVVTGAIGAVEVGMAALANPGAVATAANVAAEVAGVTGTAGAGGMTVRALSTEGRALANAQPVANALKSDSIHRSASFVRQEAAQSGTHTALVGGDGVTRTLTQIPGGLNGQVGRFEYIVDKAGDLTHQRFVPGGSINGAPNKP